MTNETYKSRHVTALLMPETPEEQTISILMRELAVLSFRYKGDAVMLPAVTSLGQCIIKLAGDGNPGRIDPTTLIREVEGMVGDLGVPSD